MTADGRVCLQKITFDVRQPLMEKGPQRKITFGQENLLDPKDFWTQGLLTQMIMDTKFWVHERVLNKS